MTPNLPPVDPNSTSGSTVRHAVTGAVASVIATALSAYLGLPPEYAVPIATTITGGLLGGLWRRWLK